MFAAHAAVLTPLSTHLIRKSAPLSFHAYLHAQTRFSQRSQPVPIRIGIWEICSQGMHFTVRESCEMQPVDQIGVRVQSTTAPSSEILQNWDNPW